MFLIGFCEKLAVLYTHISGSPKQSFACRPNQLVLEPFSFFNYSCQSENYAKGLDCAISCCTLFAAIVERQYQVPE